MKLTKKLVRGLKPCTTKERIQGFLKYFPSGELTLEGCLEALRKGYNVEWALSRLYPGFGVAYRKALAPALEAYNKAVAPAVEAYLKAMDLVYLNVAPPSPESYNKDIAPAVEAYLKAIAPYGEAYKKDREQEMCRIITQIGI